MKEVKKYPREIPKIGADNGPDDAALRDKEEKNKSLAAEVQKDFEARREMRRNIEAKWMLNINFMLGN